jgi:hypothetical protein
LSDAAQPDFTVKIRSDRDTIISKPEAGFEVTYRREMYSPVLIASDVLRNDFDESKVTLLGSHPLMKKVGIYLGQSPICS